MSFFPVHCTECSTQFPDKLSCDKHMLLVHVQQSDIEGQPNFDPRSLTVKQLRDELIKRKLNSSGNRAILVRRLEVFFAVNKC